VKQQLGNVAHAIFAISVEASKVQRCASVARALQVGVKPTDPEALTHTSSSQRFLSHHVKKTPALAVSPTLHRVERVRLHSRGNILLCHALCEM